MNVAILTLFEGHYHMGVAALINSLKTKTRFKGTFYGLYRGAPPPWESLFTNGPGIDGIKVVLKHVAPSRFLGYHKPFAALEVLERDPELDGVIYADPDVVFLAPWPFFEEWLNSGVALCLDWSHAWLHPNHPWRYKWKELVRRAGLKVVRECGEYPNGGFFGVTRSRSNVLKNWVTATLEFEKEGGDTSKYDQANRLQAVVSDQDLLAAALHTVSDEISYIGEEGMGFNNHFFVLSHAINLKPWCQCFSWQALKGHTPKATGRYWMECSRYPIPVLRPSKYVLTRMDFAFAQLISRVWKR